MSKQTDWALYLEYVTTNSNWPRILFIVLLSVYMFYQFSQSNVTFSRTIKYEETDFMPVRCRKNFWFFIFCPTIDSSYIFPRCFCPESHLSLRFFMLFLWFLSMLSAANIFIPLFLKAIDWWKIHVLKLSSDFFSCCNLLRGSSVLFLKKMLLALLVCCCFSVVERFWWQKWDKTAKMNVKWFFYIPNKRVASLMLTHKYLQFFECFQFHSPSQLQILLNGSLFSLRGHKTKYFIYRHHRVGKLIGTLKENN